jgi:hypothetical protein
VSPVRGRCSRQLFPRLGHLWQLGAVDGVWHESKCHLWQGRRWLITVSCVLRPISGQHLTQFLLEDQERKQGDARVISDAPTETCPDSAEAIQVQKATMAPQFG